jgi:hypothetical protein
LIFHFHGFLQAAAFGLFGGGIDIVHIDIKVGRRRRATFCVISIAQKDARITDLQASMHDFT